MAAPEYVPVKPMDDVRAYESPPRRPDSWMAQRPGDLKTGQPRGPRFGNPGPDQGYALVLAHRLRDDLQLQQGESADDAIHGCVMVALKRASLMGRAPVIHDLRIAFTVWGFLDGAADAQLVELRKTFFASVAVAGHDEERRRIVNAVKESTLRKAPDAVKTAYAVDWRSLLELP